MLQTITEHYIYQLQWWTFRVLQLLWPKINWPYLCHCLCLCLKEMIISICSNSYWLFGSFSNLDSRDAWEEGKLASKEGICRSGEGQSIYESKEQKRYCHGWLFWIPLLIWSLKFYFLPFFFILKNTDNSLLVL